MCVCVCVCVLTLCLLTVFEALGDIQHELKLKSQLPLDVDFEDRVPAMKEALNSARIQIRNAAVTKAEHYLCQVLQRPTSSKFQGRLIEYTTRCSVDTESDWSLHVHADIVSAVKAGLGSSASARARPAKKTRAE